jgi:GDP-L-fucose synthase
MRNVIVTGATGFLGRTLVRILCERFGPDCVVIALSSAQADLLRRDATFESFERISWTFDCDHIIHLAALYKAGDWPVRHPSTQFHVNMSINVNLLEAWRRFFPKAKLTSILSYSMYPPHNAPHPESEIYGTEPEEYLFAYAFTKKAMLIGQKAYAREHGLRSTSVILPTVYGPGDSFHEDSHVVGALIGKFVQATRAGATTVEVWGDGTQEREFLFVDDAASGIIAAALASNDEALNLGTGLAYSVGDIARRIREAAGFAGEIVFDTRRFVGVKRRVLDVSKMRKTLGWVAPTSIDDGLERTVRWHQAQLRSA